MKRTKAAQPDALTQLGIHAMSLDELHGEIARLAADPLAKDEVRWLKNELLKRTYGSK